MAFFALGAGFLVAAGQTVLGMILAVVVIIHYIISYDRFRWLFAH